MMVPFDGTGGPPPGGHPQGVVGPMGGLAPPPGPPMGLGGPLGGRSHSQPPPQQQQPQHPGGMGGPPMQQPHVPYGHRNSLGMQPPPQQGPPYMQPPPSPARQGSFTGSTGGGMGGGLPPPPNQHNPYGQPQQPLHSPHHQQRHPQQQQQAQQQHYNHPSVQQQMQQQQQQQHHQMPPQQGMPPNYRHPSLGGPPPPPHMHDLMGTSSQGSHSTRGGGGLLPQQQGMPPQHPGALQQQQHPPHGYGGMGGGMPPSGMPPNNHHPHHPQQHPSQQQHHLQQQQLQQQQQPPPPLPQQQHPHHTMNGSSQQQGSSSAAANSGAAGQLGGGSWQSDSDTPHRREMIQQIVKLLRKDKGGSPESLAKLPQMAKQLEVSLYRNAPSFDAYRDMSTLKRRLQHIAAEVQRKTTSGNGGASSSSSQPSSSRQQPQHPHDDRSSSSVRSSSYVDPRGGGGGTSASQQQHMAMRGADGASPFMGNSSSSSMSMGLSQQPPPPYGGGAGASRPPGGGGGGSSGRAGGGGGGGNNAAPPAEDWKMRIKHKQQRLLLLHHSAKCPHENGTCPTTQHCADMKRLWRHMEGCKDNGCRVPHCFSSRAILSHYRKCKDPSCPACGPVRQTVRKSKAGGGGGGGAAPPPPTGGAYGQPPSMSNSVGSGMGATVRTSNAVNPSLLMQQQQQSSSQQPSDGLLPSGSFQSSSSSVGSNFPQQPPQRSAMPPPPGSAAALQQQQRRQSYTSSQQPQQPFLGSNGASPPSQYRSHSPPGSPGMGALPDANRLGRPDVNRPNHPRHPDSSEWQKIRHKQQRLLLLRHASRCQHEAGRCPVTPHCASMKKLWEHIAHCRNQQCPVQHCLSSRYVLSHYRRCKDKDCPACGPVRETIKKSREKEEKRNLLQQQGQPQQPGGVGSASYALDTSIGGSASGFAFDDPHPSPASDSYQPEPKRAKYEAPPVQEASSSDQLAVPSLSHEIAGSAGVDVAPRVVSSSAPEPPLSAPAAPAAVPSADAQTSQAGLDRGESAGGKTADKDTKNASDLSLLQSFTVKQLQTHLASLDRKTLLPPAKLKAKLTEVLKGLQTHQHGWVFNSPVDPVELGLPDYFDIIKKPMDLGTIQKKLENGAYHAIEDFQTDVLLTFDNAMTYNEDGSVVYDMAKELRIKFEGDRTKLMAQLESEDLQRRQNERACTLCGCEKLLFEPPVYFCNGMNCQNQRIRRNSHFYIGGNNQYFWCSTCFNELDDKIPIELVDMSITKGDLKKKKNDEVHEESWVQCDTCQRWVHQICGLFNGRQNTQQHSEYCCPRCLCEKQTVGKAVPASRPPGAADLPRTLLSEWLEKHIMKRVERKKRQLAEDKAAAEGITLEEATTITDSGPIFVRQVTSMDRKLEVRDLMRKRYAHKNYPEEFSFRCKCIVVFQELEGVDTVLFALYLYEHGEDNPPPNQRVVYISYLDSVHFMRPRRIRTFVYHEILIAYLDYARRRGFATVHIWACPPLKGDDYIFYAKPEDQKTPRDARLRQWYIDMLVECQKRSIVGKLTNMYDLYFANETLDATAVPYLEGDYFPGEAENIIKMIEEGGGKKSAAGGKKKKAKSSSKNKGGTGTRSSGVDELSLIESGCFGGVRSFKDLDRDPVMIKLGETINPMKDSFIVAFLNCSGAKDEDMVVPPEIEKARLEYASEGEIDDLTGSKRDANALSLVDRDGQPIKVIDDDAEDLDCEFLNNRQAFLNLCRGNHYQFDELRRSKHTSMMVLWHLHNRDAPKFVQQCVVCGREILSGMRYHCNTCPDYDLCQDCFKNPATNRGTCAHKLQPVAVDAEAAQERSGMTEEQRQQRQRNITLHIQLIEHAARCTSRACQSNNCVKMKSYLDHSRTCRVKAGGGCKICKRIWTLLRIHAQKCKERVCPIPQCMAIREKMRQLQKQQQAMDDRRRLEMNRHMRFSMAGGAGAPGGQAG